MRSSEDFFGSLSGKEPKPRGEAGPPGEKPKPPPPQPAQAPQPRPGELFRKGDVIGGKFEVHGTLGKGGFGVVYVVYNRSTGEVQALKTFRDEFLADPEARRAFQSEALLWVNLEEHPYILPARWVEEVSGRLFVAMDYIAPDEQGRVSLEDHLRHTRGPLPVETSLVWAVQFCRGMEHANSHGVGCHRDIKPANILIARDGAVKIADFGLAAAADALWRRSEEGPSFSGRDEDGSSFRLLCTQGRKWCGTPGYVAPEVCRGEAADVRSDIYSFGLVLWQMATGSTAPPFSPPYRGDIEAYMAAVYREMMTGRVPSVPEPWGPVIARCLAPERGQRYRDFAELRAELEALCRRRGLPIPEPPKAGVKTVAFWVNRGGSLGALGRHEEALRCCDKALEIDPRFAAAWSNKGVSLGALGRYEEALRCLDQALEIDPRYAAAWYNKALCEEAVGRGAQAARSYRKFIELAPPQDGAGIAHARQRVQDLEGR